MGCGLEVEGGACGMVAKGAHERFQGFRACRVLLCCHGWFRGLLDVITGGAWVGTKA